MTPPMLPTRAVLTNDDARARLTLQSADGQNRIGAQTIEDIKHACALLHEDGNTRTLTITGADRAFSLGWAPDLLQSLADGDETVLPGDVFGCLAALPLPVIAAIDGDAISAGLELALACDLRVASGRSRFALPEGELGLLPLAGGSQRLPRAIGRTRALSLLLLGTVLDAETALAWGLLNELSGGASATEAARRIADSIAARGPIAERFAKEAVQFGMEMPLARALNYELDLTVLLQTTEDRAEGVRAFAEKRTPHFTGR